MKEATPNATGCDFQPAFTDDMWFWDLSNNEDGQWVNFNDFDDGPLAGVLMVRPTLLVPND